MKNIISSEVILLFEGKFFFKLQLSVAEITYPKKKMAKNNRL